MKNSVHQKCLLGSAIAHSLLLAILVFGPAFAPARPPLDNLPVLEIIPSNLILTDEKAFGGGGPSGAPAPAPAKVTVPPPPAPTPVTPQPLPPEPKKTAPPEPKSAVENPPPQKTTPPKPEKVEKLPEDLASKNKTIPSPDGFAVKDAKKEKPKRDVIVNLKVAKRAGAVSSDEEEAREVKRRAEERARNIREARETAVRQQQAQAAYRAWQNKLNSALDGASKDLASRSTIDLGPVGAGLGGVGPAYANYGQVVLSLYDNAWVPPDEVNDESLVVRVRITIARDGTVTSDSIVKRSGNAILDRSVQRTLERIRSVPPFPDSAKDSQRTYYINFQLRANKRV